MKIKAMYPDYDHCISGIPNALLHHYGVHTSEYRMPKLKRALKHNYKNTVLIILDGMGIDMMQHQLGLFSFLRRHIKDKISSVFPPTTVAATTTFYTGLEPVEHGWLGWAPYFKDLNRVVEMFTDKDFYTGESVGEKVSDRIPYQHIFDRIKAVNPAIQLTAIFPSSIQSDGPNNFQEMCDRIEALTQKNGEQFILAYWPEPDSTSHEFGPYSKEVRNVLLDLNQKVQQLCAKLKDTLIIISADHGHIENNSEIMIDDYPDLVDCFSVPLSLDMRTQAIFLKPNKEEEFLNLFKKYLAPDFLLLKSEEAVTRGLFGKGKTHPCVKDLLGDYLIIAKTEKSLVQRFPNDVYSHLKGQHSGLTNAEMIVPLILIKKD